MILETQHFDFCLAEQPSYCSVARLSSCWSVADHHISLDYDLFVLNLYYRHVGNHPRPLICGFNVTAHCCCKAVAVLVIKYLENFEGC